MLPPLDIDTISAELDDQRAAPMVPPSALATESSTRLRRFYLVWNSVVAVAVLAVTLSSGWWVESVVVAGWWLFISVRLDRERRLAELLDIRRHFRRLGAWLAFAAAVGLFVQGTVESAKIGMVAIAACFAGSFIARKLVQLPRGQHLLGFGLRESLLLVGDRDEVARTLREWVRVDSIEVVGVCLPESDEGAPVVEGHPVIGSARDIVRICRGGHIDAVALHDCGDLGGRQLARLQWELEKSHTFISLVTPVANTAVQRVQARSAGRRLIVDLAMATPAGVVVVLRAMLDRFAALLVLLLTSPVLLAAAAAIKFTSRGPVVFTQTRVRENNRTFTIFKLRTMSVDAEARRPDLDDFNEVGGDGLFKMEHDPRVTTVGKLLRRLSIDELPQLLNVLKGEMALVGPRPALPEEVASYDEMAQRRLAIKPGLTGLWQVSGRSNLSWEESIRLDMDYVDNWSPQLDGRIVRDTVRAVLRREGAY